MNRNLKDQIIALHFKDFNVESIAEQLDASIGYVRSTINGFQRNEEYAIINSRNKAVADDFLSVPISDKFSNFILIISKDPETYKKVSEAYDKMINSKGTDKLW